MDLSIGDLVISEKGRDQKRIFMVMELLDENYVAIADGLLRKIESPKKKKIRHLTYFGIGNDRILEKLNENKKITNAELRKMIKNFDNESSEQSTIVKD